MHVIKIQKFVLTLIILPRIMLFFKPEVLKNGLKFELRNSIKGVSVIYEGDPRSNANTSVISSTFGISKNGLHVYHDILSIL